MKRNPDQYRFLVVTDADEVFNYDSQLDIDLVAQGYEPESMKRFGYLPDMPTAFVRADVARLAEAERQLRALRERLVEQYVAYDTEFLSTEEVSLIRSHGEARGGDERWRLRQQRFANQIEEYVGKPAAVFKQLWPPLSDETFQTLYAFVRAGERRTLRHLVRALARRAVGFPSVGNDAQRDAGLLKIYDAQTRSRPRPGTFAAVGHAVWERTRQVRGDDAIAATRDLDMDRSIDDVAEFLDAAIVRAVKFEEHDMIVAINAWEDPDAGRWRTTSMGQQALAKRAADDVYGKDTGVEWYLAAEYLHAITPRGHDHARPAASLKNQFLAWLKKRTNRLPESPSDDDRSSVAERS